MIVCLNRNEAHRIFEVASKNKQKINFPITFDEFINKEYNGVGCKCFHIDNADLFIQHLSMIPVETISVNN